MISIYLDWNVMAQMKNGHHPELAKLCSSGRFLIPFTSSHISDIYTSFKKDDPQQQAYIDSDLRWIEQLCGDHFLQASREHVQIVYRLPRSVFEAKVEEGDITEHFSLATLQQQFDEVDPTGALGKTFMASLNVPLDQGLIDALNARDPNNPNEPNILEKMFPRVKDNPTMEQWMLDFMDLYQRMNATEFYKELREAVQQAMKINPHKMVNENDPFAAIEKMYAQWPVPPPETNIDGKVAPPWFNDVSNAYFKLDVHGYKQDKVSIKGRKETFRNTTEDSFHAAYASTCDVYITNDHRAHEKSRQVFRELDLRTGVFTPEEFLQYYHVFLSPRLPKSELNLVAHYLRNGEMVDYEEGAIGCYVYHTMFDYFNLLMRIPAGPHPAVVLSRIMPTNRVGAYRFEIRAVANRLSEAFGIDQRGRGAMAESELSMTESWVGRHWVQQDLDIALELDTTGNVILRLQVIKPPHWKRIWRKIVKKLTFQRSENTINEFCN
jgi:hypothetical protein